MYIVSLNIFIINYDIITSKKSKIANEAKTAFLHFVSLPKTANDLTELTVIFTPYTIIDEYH